MASPNTPQDPNKPEILQILDEGTTPEQLRAKETQIEQAIKSDVESLTEAQLADISTEDFLDKVLDTNNTDVFASLGQLLVEDIGNLDDEYMKRVKSALRLKIREQLNSSFAEDNIKTRLNELLGVNDLTSEEADIADVDYGSQTGEELLKMVDSTKPGSFSPEPLEEYERIEFDFEEDEDENFDSEQSVEDLPAERSTDDQSLEDFQDISLYPDNEESSTELPTVEYDDLSLDESMGDLSADLSESTTNVEPITEAPVERSDQLLQDEPLLGPDESPDLWRDLEHDQEGPSHPLASSHPDDPFAERSNVPADLNSDEWWIDTGQPRESQVPEFDPFETSFQASTRPGRLEREYSVRPQAPNIPYDQVRNSVPPMPLTSPQDNPDESTLPPDGSGWDAETQVPQSIAPQVESLDFPPGAFPEEFNIDDSEESLTQPIQPAAPESSGEGLNSEWEQAIADDVALLRPQLGDNSQSMEAIKQYWHRDGADDFGYTQEEYRVEAMSKFFRDNQNSEYLTDENRPIIQRAIEYYQQIILPELNQVSQGDASPQTPQALHSAGPSSVQPDNDPSDAPEGRRTARRSNLEPVAPTPHLDLSKVEGRRQALEQNPELMEMAEERFYRDLDDIFATPKSSTNDAVQAYLTKADDRQIAALAMALGLEFDITKQTLPEVITSVVNAYNQRYFSDQGRRELSRNALVKADMEELALDTLHNLYGQPEIDKTVNYTFDDNKALIVDDLTDQQKVALAIYYKIGGDLTKPATLNKLRNKITSEQQAHGLIQPDGSFLYENKNPLVEDIYFDVMSEFHAEDLRKPEVKAQIAKMVSMRVMQEKLDMIQAKYDEANAPQWYEDFGKLARVAAPGVLAAMMFSGIFPTWFVGETVGAGAFALLKGWGSLLVASEGFALSTFGYVAATGFFAANTAKHLTKLINPFGKIKKEHKLEENLMTTLRGGGKLMTNRANGELQVSNVNPEAGMQRRQIMDMQKKWKDERRTIYQTTFNSMKGNAADLNSPSAILKAIHEGVGKVNLGNISNLQAVSAGKTAARTELGFSASMMGIPSLLGYAGKKMFT